MFLSFGNNKFPQISSTLLLSLLLLLLSLLLSFIIIIIIIVILRFGRCLEYFSFVFILGPVLRWVFWACWGRARGPERQRTQTPVLCFSGLLALSWRPGGPGVNQIQDRNQMF